MTTRPHCETPDACTATGRGHCRRCALKVSATAVAAARAKGGQRSQAVQREHPAFVEKLRDAARPLAAGLSAHRETVERRAETLRETMAERTAKAIGIPVELVDEYRRMRRIEIPERRAIAILKHSFPAAFDHSIDPSAWPFDGLQMFGFDVIMADPPWLFRTRSERGLAKSPQAQYECMPTSAIAALPVNQLARRDCWLWLWATFPMIEDGLEVMRAWGFRFVTGGTWVKRGDSGKLAFGTGFVFRGNAEVILIGKVGNPQTHSKAIRNVIEAPRGQHSEKPDLAYETAETLFGPDATRADLFSCRNRPGWTAWGNQTGLLDEGGKRVRRIPTVIPPRVAAPADPSQAGLFEVAA